MQPPLTPTHLPPRVLEFSPDLLEDTSPIYDPSKPTAGQQFIEQLTLSPITPVQRKVTFSEEVSTADVCGARSQCQSQETSIPHAPKLEPSTKIGETAMHFRYDKKEENTGIDFRITASSSEDTLSESINEPNIWKAANLSNKCMEPEIVFPVQNRNNNEENSQTILEEQLLLHKECPVQNRNNNEENSQTILEEQLLLHKKCAVQNIDNKFDLMTARLQTIIECEEDTSECFIVDTDKTNCISEAKIKHIHSKSENPNKKDQSRKRKLDSNLHEVCNTIRNFNDSYTAIMHATSQLATNFHHQYNINHSVIQYSPFNNLIQAEISQECMKEVSIIEPVINIAKIVNLLSDKKVSSPLDVYSVTTKESGLTPLMKRKLNIHDESRFLTASYSPEVSVMETKMIVSERNHQGTSNKSTDPHIPTPNSNNLCRYVKAQSKEGDSRNGGRSHSEGGSEHGTSSRGPNSCFDSFERLLDDPCGMHAFAEFLKKEFSHENIYFWVACEKYRRLDCTARKIQARAIFQRHLAAGAPEPVNVDSQARQSAREGLEQAKADLFLSAQKQIFNLMKFDSYPRYLKCSESALEPASPLVELDPDLLLHAGDEPNPGKLKKSRSDAEDRRRKSLLPWNRGGGGKSAGQSRSKSRDRADTPAGAPEDSSSLKSELTGSRSSLASSDLALIQRGSSSRQSLSSGGEGGAAAELCRVLLPDGATTVIPTQRGETTKQLIVRLLDKRGLHFSSFELFMENDTKAVILSEDSTVLSGKEVRVERRVVFRLDLPSRKTVGVKAKAGRTLSEVLKPILHKYGYRLENTTVTLICDTEPLDPSLLITAVENQRLQATVTGPEGWREKGSASSSKNGATLDEITNRVFEELLQGKSADSADGQLESAALSDQGSVRSEDWSSEHSSGIFGRFLRRDSAFLDKTRESRSQGGKKCAPQSKHTSLELDTTKFAAAVDTASSVSNVSAKTKWKLRPQVQGKSESDELYEGLKRAQRSRLEDQRGTQINFQLPDFLKDKENTPEQARRLKKGRLGEGECVPLLTSDGLDLSVSEGIIPSPGQADNYFSPSSDQSETYFCEPAPPPPLRHTNQPPPLPPKPKPANRPDWQSEDAEAKSHTVTSFV